MTVKRTELPGMLASIAADLDPTAFPGVAKQPPATAEARGPASNARAPDTRDQLVRSGTAERVATAPERATPPPTARPDQAAGAPVQGPSLDDLKGQGDASAWLRDMSSRAQLRVGRAKAGQPSNVKLGAVLAGPDGVGKRFATTVYASMLARHGAISDPTVHSIDVRAVLEDGGSLADAIKNIKSGVILFENAQVLNAQKNKADLKAISDLAAADTEPVVVLSGLPELRGLVDSSWRLAESFRTQVDFKFLQPDVLADIFVAEAKAKGFAVSDAVRAAAFGRLRSAGRNGAKAAQDLVRYAEGQMAKRLFPGGDAPAKPLSEKDLTTFVPEDLKGDSPFDAKGDLKALKRLDENIGQAELKAWARALAMRVVEDLRRQSEGKKVSTMSLNAVIKGPPGTGKTSVVEVLNDILTQLGLRNGKLVYRTAADLKGSVRGEAERLTREAHEEARGGMLIIDEAHNLAGDEFGRKVVEALVPLSYNHRDTTSVFLLGYSGPMDEMLNVDQGMRDRFSEVIETKSFVREELRAILKQMVGRAEYKLAEGSDEAAVRILDTQRAGRDFGNARAVENMVSRAITRAAARTRAAGEEDILVAGDFGPPPLTLEATLAKLDAFVGFEHVREHVAELARMLEDQKAEGGALLDSFDPYIQVIGPEGSGRKSLAAILAEIYNNFGLIGASAPVVVNALDLRADFQGQTKTNVRETVERALGGMLILGGLGGIVAANDTYAKEAISTLKSELKKHHGRLTVAFVGRPEEVAAFLAMDPELGAMVGGKIELNPMTAEGGAKIFEAQLATLSRTLDDEARAALPALMERLAAAPSWGGGNDVRRLALRVYSAHSTIRHKDEYAGRDAQLVSLEALQAGVDKLVIEKKTQALNELAAKLPIMGRVLDAPGERSN